ncbi:transcriptional regulator, PadR family [Archaeoglobus sulfaticallidus PM70-1]|uniref:Transcriptional regulator, PadR family n=1 Tax=Archaeoglobus sulfaticallidus PM70-1 TaxID=387631 RepID=N0BB51_9EURY|nr:PadR family transcriptional regulator [Archaeoglobus sulfaticallidus]AGK60834.1 transcriptional regulator, PadR family [Archaeoglobus sulfaticallidus PM70-1]
MLDRKLFLGFVRVHILYHASKGEIYGAWMMKELARHGYSLSPGTLYPILHEMERDGLLQSKKVVVNGKVRKVYRITEKGLKMLEMAKKRVKELFSEVME